MTCPWVCPMCFAPLVGDGNRLTCAGGHSFPSLAGIPDFVGVTPASARPSEQFFNRLYEVDDPYEYERNGAETLKYEYIKTWAVAQRTAQRQTMLEVGCSSGLLTEHLAPLGFDLLSFDLVHRAAARAQSRAPGVPVAAASVLAMPVATDSIDVLLACDGLASWKLADEAHAVDELARVLRASGIAFFMDYVSPKNVPAFRRSIERRFVIEAEDFLHDRLFFKLKKLLKPFTARKGSAFERVAFARKLQRWSRLAGTSGTKHFVFVAKKKNVTL